MGMINSFANWIIKKATTAREPDQWIVRWAQGGALTDSGIVISNDSALKIATVFACMRAISEDIAKLPLNIYQTVGAGKEKRDDHPVHHLLHTQPNPFMTAMDWRSAITSHALGWGNGYSLIQRNKFGQILYLWPIAPNRMIPVKKDGKLYYKYTNEQSKETFYEAYDILPIFGLGFDGLQGYNVVHYARECLGAAKATEKFGARWFGKGTNPGGYYEHPNSLSDKAFNRLKESLKEYAGIEQSHENLILEEGMKFNKSTIPPEESQFLQTRQFSVPEICRWFRMNPNKVADTTRAQGWSTLEQTNTDYVVDCLMPWVTRWEQNTNIKLFTPEEQANGYFVKHNLDALLRGDIAARYAAYAIGKQWGFLNSDEIRDKEELNPLPDGKGQEYLTPLNMVGTNPAMNAIITDSAKRIYAAELEEVLLHYTKAAGGDKKRWNNWLDTFYSKHKCYIVKVLTPLYQDIHKAEAVADAYINEHLALLTSKRIEVAIKSFKSDNGGYMEYLIMKQFKEQN